MKEKYIVYEHIAPNGKVYVGITGISTTHRWNSGKGYLNQRLFGNAIKKYGWDNFEHKIILDNQTKSEACYAEKYLIRYYKARKMSYNAADGGEINKGFHQTQKTKISISNHLKGIKRSEETKHKISISHIGFKPSEESKQKNRLSHLGVCNLSEVGRLKIIETHKGKKRSKETIEKLSKPRSTSIKVTIDNDLNIYSINQLSDKYNLSRTHIRKLFRESHLNTITLKTHTITIVTK